MTTSSNSPLAPATARRHTPGEVLATSEPSISRCARVLVVDDNTDAAELLAEWLQSLGHETRVAFDGAAALDAAEDFVPDLALVDLGLPILDGYEVARRLKLSPRLMHTHLVALTGYGQESDRIRSREAGFNEHLVKPVDLDRLMAIVRAVSARPPASG